MKSMKLNRFVQLGKPSPIHSSGFVQNTDRIGSTSADPFSKRLQRDRSRQLVGGYRDAQVLRQAQYDNRNNISTSRRDVGAPAEVVDSQQIRDQRRGSRIDIVRPTAIGSTPSMPGPRGSVQQHTFREPPSRHRP